MWEEGGLDAVNALNKTGHNAHIRLGLARHVPDGEECYLMVNNILFY